VEPIGTLAKEGTRVRLTSADSDAMRFEQIDCSKRGEGNRCEKLQGRTGAKFRNRTYQKRGRFGVSTKPSVEMEIRKQNKGRLAEPRCFECVGWGIFVNVKGQ
jgi:hypothetical protein